MASVESLFLKLVELSAAASGILLAVFLLRLLFRRAPKWILCAFWGLAALRLLLPFSVESSLSLLPKEISTPAESLFSEPAAYDPMSLPNRAAWELENAKKDTPTLPEAAGNVGETSIPGIAAENDGAGAGDPVFTGGTVGTDTALSADSMTGSTEPGAAVGISADLGALPEQDALSGGGGTTVRLSFVLACVWLTGAAAMLLYAGGSSFLLRRRIATATRLRKNIWQSDRIRFPFVFGLLRPRIYLPYNVGGADLSYVLAHEQAHIRRGDPLWKALGFALLSVYWFHPLVWIAYALLCRDIETACDEKVISKMEKEERRAYSTALLRCSVRSRTAVCPLAFGEVGVKSRIRGIMRYRKPGRMIAFLALAASAAAAICLLTSPLSAEAAEDPFGHEYKVEKTVYTSDPTLPDSSSSRFSTTKEREMFVLNGKKWESQGILREIKLSRDNFDPYFSSSDGSTSGGKKRVGDEALAKSLRRDSDKVYALNAAKGESPDFYYFMQQKNGELYLVHVFYTKVDDMLITRLFRIAPDDQETAAEEKTAVNLPPPVAEGTYVAKKWLYINPINQTVPAGRETGRKYVVKKDSFTTYVRDLSLSYNLNEPDKDRYYRTEEVLKDVTWKWEEFPYSIEEWQSFFKPAGETVEFPYKNLRLQRLSSNKILLYASGRLWLAEFAENRTLGPFLWGIVELAYQTDVRTVEWQIPADAGVFMTGVRLRMDGYKIKTAESQNGLFSETLGDPAAYARSVGRLTNEDIMNGNFSGSYSADALYWIPIDPQGQRVYTDQLFLRFEDPEGKESASALLTVTSSERANGSRVYTLTLYKGDYSSDELNLQAIPDLGEIRIVKPKNESGRGG